MLSILVPVIKNPPANAGDARDVGSIPGLVRSLGIENGNPLQYSSLENSMDRGAWQAIYSSWGCRESDMTKHTHADFFSEVFIEFVIMLLLFFYVLGVLFFGCEKCGILVS